MQVESRVPLTSACNNLQDLNASIAPEHETGCDDGGDKGQERCEDCLAPLARFLQCLHNGGTLTL
jgi:hypothetical protein